jgi:hypothetical protein
MDNYESITHLHVELCVLFIKKKKKKNFITPQSLCCTTQVGIQLINFYFTYDLSIFVCFQFSRTMFKVMTNQKLAMENSIHLPSSQI